MIWSFLHNNIYAVGIYVTIVTRIRKPAALSVSCDLDLNESEKKGVEENASEKNKRWLISPKCTSEKGVG